MNVADIRGLFPGLKDTIYLNTATMAVGCTPARAAYERAIDRWGGHCPEGFVSDPAVRVIIDVSPMKRVYYDVERGAVAIEAGATVGETFRALFETWGSVIPLGEYPEIGMEAGARPRRRRAGLRDQFRDGLVPGWQLRCDRPWELRPARGVGHLPEAHCVPGVAAK